MQRLGALIGLWAMMPTPAPAHEPQTVYFTSDDGVGLVADYAGPDDETPAPAVILLHMYRSDRHAWQPLMDRLHNEGFAVLAIDMRGHGDSTAPDSMRLVSRVQNRDETLFRSMYRDVMAAYDFLATQPHVDLSRLAVVGASVGCSVAIDYAARDASVDVVVCMTPGERYLGLNSRQHIARFAKHGQRPMLLLATEGERQASDVLGKICKHATVDIVGPGQVHGTRMFGQIDGIEQKIVDFIKANIGHAGDTPVAAPVDGRLFFAVGSQLDIDLDAAKRRLFSSAQEALDRGFKPAKGVGAAMIHDGVDQPELDRP